MTGIAGYGTMQIYMPKRGVHEHLTFYARAPLAGAARRFGVPSAARSERSAAALTA